MSGGCISYRYALRSSQPSRWRSSPLPPRAPTATRERLPVGAGHVHPVPRAAGGDGGVAEHGGRPGLVERRPRQGGGDRLTAGSRLDPEPVRPARRLREVPLDRAGVRLPRPAPDRDAGRLRLRPRHRTGRLRPALLDRLPSGTTRPRSRPTQLPRSARSSRRSSCTSSTSRGRPSPFARSTASAAGGSSSPTASETTAAGRGSISPSGRRTARRSQRSTGPSRPHARVRPPASSGGSRARAASADILCRRRPITQATAARRPAPRSQLPLDLRNVRGHAAPGGRPDADH